MDEDRQEWWEIEHGSAHRGKVWQRETHDNEADALAEAQRFAALMAENDDPAGDYGYLTVTHHIRSERVIFDFTVVDGTTRADNNNNETKED